MRIHPAGSSILSQTRPPTPAKKRRAARFPATFTRAALQFCRNPVVPEFPDVSMEDPKRAGL